ncbi:MAG: RNA 2',3'-cyclic phosphodiesterase [Deltaproteobacteria bacterium]|nr:RNA 2',3'-cyclic phosphodiesterase [Deltaproteobacteria bacterium]
MRLFLAYELPDDLQQQIYQVFSPLHQRLRNFAWVKPGRLHLTLRFLGEVSEDFLQARLIPVFEEEFSKLGPFQLSFQGLGLFPNLSRPRVLWLGVKGDTLKLKHQALQLEKKLDGQQVQQYHKAFSPHITLAKMKEVQKNVLLGRLIQEYEKTDFGIFEFKAPSLFESVLGAEGSAYKILRKF